MYSPATNEYNMQNQSPTSGWASVTRESILLEVEIRYQVGELGEVLDDKESWNEELDIRDRSKRWWEIFYSFEDEDGPWLWCFA